MVKSSLTHFNDLPFNNSKEEICSEYEDVGSHTFTSFISNLWVQDPSYPTFKHLQVKKVFFHPVVKGDVDFDSLAIEVEPKDKI